MFFDEMLLKSKSFNKTWLAANNLSYRSNEARLPDICRKLKRWVGSDNIDARRRLSLRTSSVLIDGAARLYKQEMEQLFNDLSEMNRKMITRKRRLSTIDEEEFGSSEKQSGSVSTPEEMLRQSRQPSETSLPRRNTKSIRKSSLQMLQTYHSLSSCSHDDSTSESNISRSSSSSKRPKTSESFTHESIELTSKDETDDEESDKVNDKHECNPSSALDNTNSNEKAEKYINRENGSKHSIVNMDESPTFTNLDALEANQRSNDESSDSKDDSNKSSSENIDDKRSKRNGSDQNSILTPKAVQRREDSGSDASKSDGTLYPRKERMKTSEREPRREDKKNEGDETDSSSKSIILRSSVIRKGKAKTKRRSRQVSPKILRRDQGTQTSRPFSTMQSSTVSEGFDISLPFGYLLIHDSFKSRIPSKIVLSSLNSNVRDLVCL